MNPIFGDIIGIIGVFIIVIAYILMQIDRMDPKGFSFSLLNTLGAIMILISLFYSWNLASFIMEAIWFTLSLYGTIKAYMFSKNTSNHLE
jgi:hypothetical protein